MRLCASLPRRKLDESPRPVPLGLAFGSHHAVSRLDMWQEAPIWLAQRAVALVIIIIGSQILFGLLRSWWHSKAWLRTAAVFLLSGMWRIFAAVTLLVALCTPIGWIALFLDWRKRYGPISRAACIKSASSSALAARVCRAGGMYCSEGSASPPNGSPGRARSWGLSRCPAPMAQWYLCVRSRHSPLRQLPSGVAAAGASAVSISL